MNKYIKLTCIALTAMLFTACGGSSTTDSKSNNNYGTNERMVKNKEYTVNKGDEIEKISSNPTIEIISNLETGITTAKLISGEAAIIKH